jgi:5-methyltetrahydropteroyltriglutamate--homocysteine methyltransferase
MMSRPEVETPGSPTPRALLPSEPIGSIPRPPELLEGIEEHGAGRLSDEDLQRLYEAAIRDTIVRLEATGSQVVTDGEQTKPSFATYPIAGLENLMPDGVTIPFADGHVRQLPRLTGGPFRYQTHAGTYLNQARKHAHVALKQAVIAPSALSLLYPPDGIEGYGQEAFIEDLVRESEIDIRECLEGGAHSVQMDFTEARLSIKLDPSKQLLKSFIDLNNTVLGRFSTDERARIGIHTCPGGDLDSTHSLDVDYAELLPAFFELDAGIFYIQLASEPDRRRVLGIIEDHAPADSRIFVGVIDPIDPRVETPEEVRDRVLEAADYIPVERLGTCDDCGFSPFGDDTSTSRETAFAKIAARIEGTAMAAELLGVA